jgi:signal transduction histidine kinase
MSDSGSGDERAGGGRPDLHSELRRESDASHFALLYQSHQERLDAALSFIQVGLERGERCLYVADESSAEEVATALGGLGVDVAAARERDQLRITAEKEVIPDGGKLGERLKTLVDESQADGFAGFRVTGRAGGPHRHGATRDEMHAYERQCESLAGDPFAALCQYDRRQLTDAEVVDVLQTHPKLLYHRRVCDNPYYREDWTGVGGGEKALSASQLLETVRELARAQQEIRHREQRVAVLNRVLRHNLRNDMNVIQSHAELLADTADTEAEQESIDSILSTTDRLMRIAEDAKRVEKSVGTSVADRVPVDLERVLTSAAQRARERNPTISITLPTVESRWVEASDELEFALGQLFQTLADVADEGARITVSFDDDRSTHARQALRVQCTGANLPDAEIEALTRGHETQLIHGSGLGLWLVNWIVELSGGTLGFERDGDTEEIVLSFLSAEP